MADHNDQQIPYQQQHPKPRKPRASYQYNANNHSSSSNNVNRRNHNKINCPLHKRQPPPLSKPTNANKSRISTKAPTQQMPEPNIDMDDDVQIQLKLSNVVHGVFTTKSEITHKNKKIPRGTVGRVCYSQETRDAICVVFGSPFDNIEMIVDPDTYLDFGMMYNLFIATFPDILDII